MALASDYRILAIYAQSPYVYEGGLKSYSLADMQRELAIEYAARVLKSVKPGDLPIQQPVKFQFAINLKTARALGLTIPATLQLLADEAIESRVLCCTAHVSSWPVLTEASARQSRQLSGADQPPGPHGRRV